MNGPKPAIGVVSYNIHKGRSASGLRQSLHHMRDALHDVGPDIVLVQEVQRRHRGYHHGHGHWPLSAQFEVLADTEWPYHAYGPNAVHPVGDHGNAVLSRYPIIEWENIDISLHPLEQRGILHVQIEVPGLDVPLHVCCTHLNLLHRHRRRQVSVLAARIRQSVPEHCPLLIGGDFNDWRTWVTGELQRQVAVRDAHLQVQGRHARTFPAFRPMLALDRIYVRGLSVEDARVLDGARWRRLSDHLGLYAAVRPLPAAALPP